MEIYLVGGAVRDKLLGWPVKEWDYVVVGATPEEMLAQAGHSGRLQIQISENVPPGRWRVSFPQIVAAIADVGPPGEG